MSTPTPVSSLSQLFSTLFTSVKSGLITAIVPNLLTFLQNTANLNPLSLPDQLKYLAQLDLLRSATFANITTLIPEEVQQLNALFSNELQAVLQKAQATTAKPA